MNLNTGKMNSGARMAKRRLKKKTVRIFTRFAFIFFVCAAVFSAYKFWTEQQKYAEARKSYDEIRNLSAAGPIRPHEKPAQDENEIQMDVYEPRKEIDWDGLKAIDENVVAWIEMEGSSIDYPVAHGSDNDQYLRHLIDGKYNDAGTIFVDCRNNRGFTDKNTVIYGHHMFDEPLMFAELENYESQDYYESHKVIMIHTPDAEYDVYPVAGYQTTGTGGYLQFEFQSDQEFLDYVNSFVSRSTFRSDETIAADDQMVLFSTCSYDVYNGRYVLIGKLVKVDSADMHEQNE